MTGYIRERLWVGARGGSGREDGVAQRVGSDLQYFDDLLQHLKKRIECYLILPDSKTDEATSLAFAEHPILELIVTTQSFKPPFYWTAPWSILAKVPWIVVEAVTAQF